MFSGIEYFSLADCVSAPVFQRAYDLDGGVAGTATSADQEWLQSVMTFKTTLGGRYKLQFMESIGVVDVKAPIAALVGDPILGPIAARLIDDAGVIVAYDGGYPSFGLNYVTKTNDVLRKKFLAP